jgi:hypothetical protein
MQIYERRFTNAGPMAASVYWIPMNTPAAEIQGPVMGELQNKLPAGAKARDSFGAIYGTAKAVP